MSFKFEFKIDYAKLTALLDTFLKEHSAELTSIMGQCLVLEPKGGSKMNIQQKVFITCLWCRDMQLHKNKFCTNCGHKLHRSIWV